MISSPRLARTALGVAAIAGLLFAAACGDSTPTTALSNVDSTTVVANANVSCTSPLTLTLGQVVAGVSGTGTCISGGTAASEYALVPFNGSPTTAASFGVTATGTSAAGTLADVVAANGVSFDLLSSSSTLAGASSPSYSFEAGLRSSEQAVLTPKLSTARAWARSRSAASLDVIPATVAVGQILRLNANSSSPCSAATYRGGRVVAVSNRAIVVADTGNPTGGYTDAEYASLATTFDTLIDPLDRQAFGDPSDIDGNGRVLMFFTKTVNDLTPASSSSYIGGFFYARDLFPTIANAVADACATSNMGEMFYIMVPDPTRGGAFTKANTTSEVLATLAHEYQHLINASRRMYVNTAATDFEETWLNEGLSHTAEELLFYRVSGLTPRQNLTPTVIRQSQATINAFNNYQSSNFGRFQSYLQAPSQYSPYADNDSLATRGATWSFLRYAADRAATTDGTIWYQLVNSTTTGLANLQNVFGTGVINEARDWGVAVISDDLTGATTNYQQPSWNFRSMFQALSSSASYPLSTVALTTGAHSLSLVRGANAYLRFSVAAGATASLQWIGAPAAVQFSLVRTK